MCLYILIVIRGRRSFIKKELTESNKGDEDLIMGDFNVVEKEQELPEEANYYTQNAKLRRACKSKDKIVNSKGKQFLELSENQNLIILNGRMQGNYNGEMTFIGAMGSSVSHIACISELAVENVIDFKIETCILSDHKPIIFLKTCIEEHTDNTLDLLPILKWTKQESKKFSQ